MRAHTSGRLLRMITFGGGMWDVCTRWFNLIWGFLCLVYQRKQYSRAVVLGLLVLDQCFSVCRMRDRGCMSKSVYVCMLHDCELLRYVQFNSSLCINIIRSNDSFNFPLGLIKYIVTVHFARMVIYKQHVEVTTLKCKKRPVTPEGYGCKGYWTTPHLPTVPKCVLSVTHYELSFTTMAQTYLLKLDRVRNEAMRVILRTTKDTPTETVRFMLDLPPVQTRQKVQQAMHTVVP